MITMYTKTVCPYCVKAKRFLEMHKIEYETINVEKDRDGRNWLVEQGYRAVPQFFVKGKLLVKGGANELIQMTKKQINEKIERIQGVKKDASKKQVKEK